MKTVSIDQINIHDRRFCISYPLYDGELLLSIQKIGIIQPIILLDTTPFLVVVGFRRLESAIRLGHSKISCIIDDINEKEALLYSIHDNVKRGLNIIEKAHGIEKMLHMGFSITEIHDTMVVLDLQPHEKVLNNLIAIAYAEKPLKDFIMSHRLSMQNIESLLSFDIGERKQIMELLSPMRVTESYMREVLQMMRFVKIKEGQIDLNEIRDIKNIHDLKKELKKKMNPILSSLEEEFKAIIHKCALPPNIDIKVDPFFEKEYIDIRIKGKDQEEIEDAIEKLGRVLKDGHIRSMFGLTKG